MGDIRNGTVLWRTLPSACRSVLNPGSVRTELTYPKLRTICATENVNEREIIKKKQIILEPRSIIKKIKNSKADLNRLNNQQK